MSQSNLQAVFEGHKAAVLAINLGLGFNHTRAIVLGRCLEDSVLNESARTEIMISLKSHSRVEGSSGPHSRLLAQISK